MAMQIPLLSNILNFLYGINGMQTKILDYPMQIRDLRLIVKYFPKMKIPAPGEEDEQRYVDVWVGQLKRRTYFLRGLSVYDKELNGVLLRTERHEDPGFSLQTARGLEKRYKSLDAVMSDMKYIFENARISIHFYEPAVEVGDHQLDYAAT